MKSGRQENKKARESHLFKVLHLSFEAGILLKGFDGVLEMVGGILLLAFSPGQINQAVALMTEHELSQDPNDFVARHLLLAVQNLSGNAKTFAVLFLLSHGVLKVGLVGALLRSKLWAYPTAIAVFAAFGLYQAYRYILSPSMFLVILTVLDALVIWLTWEEYRRLKKRG